MKVIINVDDFGFSQSTNDAVFELAEKGTITSTTVMVNMPFYKQVIELMKYGNISVGLHFNLTMGKPISDPLYIPSLVDKNDSFYSVNEFKRRALLGKINKPEVLTELKAQYNRLKAHIGEESISHFDSHNDITKFNVVTNALISLKHELNLKKSIRVYNKHIIGMNSTKLINMNSPRINTIKFFGLKRTFLELLLIQHTNKLGNHFTHGDGLILTKSYRALDIFKYLAEASLESLTSLEGVFEICCHPAITTADLPKTILTHTRVREYEYLKSEEFSKVKEKAQLINYDTLLKHN
ncbi:ChbG/HpnK family deacetylase [Rapidithrix thailandica]|uniref:ChbG/HpnK family deacetylase n=1 Tax=Rapidithrix thailandica TaxID=413964 RepID=A0AAW9SJW5_9BACT